MQSFANLFTGQIVRLVAVKDTDIKEARARWSNDAEFLRLSMLEPARPRPVTDFDKKEERNDPKYEFGIKVIADDKPIGYAGLEINWNHQAAWAYWAIGEPEYRHQQYLEDALRLLVSYAFRELGIYRVEIGLIAYNTQAIEAGKAVGFVHEQTDRAAVYRDGERFDQVRFGLLRPEWEQRTQPNQ